MIPILFNILFFIIPLVFYKNTSELFEFNKIVTLYLFTALIVSAWAIESIRQKKIIFRKTILNLPLSIYLFIYLVSSIFSIDPRTSWLGYYGRFNGGLISQMCYIVLYWAFISNLKSREIQKSLYYLMVSTAIASMLAILERFGVYTTCGIMGLSYTDSCWVQDVKSRVFSTLGQPNWLAAMLVALIPFTWLKSWKYYLVSILFFITLLLTKSRSGILAFGFEFLIFWGFTFYGESTTSRSGFLHTGDKTKSKHLKEFITLSLGLVIFAFVFSYKPQTNNQNMNNISVPALELGGTESGTIRKYVWQGAFEVFKHYPIIGTGPETFAYSFPMYKPVGHNLTSEWDFIYNKAHNEFLNYLANTGILGFLSYILVIVYSFIMLIKSKRFDLMSAYVGILVTNFFGFSVVTISLLFFMLPAISLKDE